VVRAVDVLEARKAAIGDGTEVRRLLPQRLLRTIGAWCFLDHYGPDEVSAGSGMRVPPHPHIGLQTASWLFDGPAQVAGAHVEPGLLAHLRPGLPAIRLSAAAGAEPAARLFIVGGIPFGERLVMWWNFVARTGEEIAAARGDWEAGRLGRCAAMPGSRWPPRRCPPPR
jgi:redox-sensitive bicupin YhaK (pirin superfamily)